MKTLNASMLFPGSKRSSRFDSAGAPAFSLAESGCELPEPRIVAGSDPSSELASPVLEGCGGPDGRRHYGASHDGRLEVIIGSETSFIFAESSLADPWKRSLT